MEGSFFHSVRGEDVSQLVVIDDGRSILHLVRKTFKDSGFETLTAGTVAAGIALIAAHSPDVVLLDIVLPQSSGLDVIKQIRELDSRLPVILMTSGGTSDLAIETMQIGAYDYILKPLHFQNLIPDQVAPLREQGWGEQKPGAD